MDEATRTFWVSLVMLVASLVLAGVTVWSGRQIRAWAIEARRLVEELRGDNDGADWWKGE